MDLNLIMQIIAIVPKIQTALKSGASVLAIIQNLAPDLIPILSAVGTTLFPQVDPNKAIQASVDAIFDSDGTMWVQTTLNKLGQTTPPLEVDGEYGELTKAAVTEYQRAHGLVVDGWAGPKTAAAMALEAAKSA